MPIKYQAPDWMKPKYSKFFRLLTTEEGLLDSVTPVFSVFGGSKQLGVELVKIGFKKSDGTPLELSTVSDLNRVVKYLNVGGEVIE